MLTLGTTVLDSTEKQSGMFEKNSLEDLGRLQSPRIFNSHLRFDQLPDEVRTKKTKLVFVYRNPKDVAVSLHYLHNHGPWWEYKGRFCNWLPLFIEGKGR